MKMKNWAVLSLSVILATSAHAGVLDGLQLHSAAFESSHATSWEGQNPVASSSGTLRGLSLHEENHLLTIQADVSYAYAGTDAQFGDMQSISISVDTTNWNHSLSQGNAFDNGFPSEGLSPAEADGVGQIRLASGRFSHAITCMVTVLEHPIQNYKETIQTIDCFYQAGDAGNAAKDLPDFTFTFEAGR